MQWRLARQLRTNSNPRLYLITRLTLQRLFRIQILVYNKPVYSSFQAFWNCTESGEWLRCFLSWESTRGEKILLISRCASASTAVLTADTRCLWLICICRCFLFPVLNGTGNTMCGLPAAVQFTPLNRRWESASQEADRPKYFPKI